ncbi:30S ribosomal protein S2 [Patescibacteria group bacterium]|nr:30S ribosomal protein S2 [Patescibacteria group bacterium]MBU1702925.1 30S ribosomal protein S2 [Patescibacteria group bacterium]MBU1953485.1 30S ribosomal protein S2 [Patescibacteria group bacterium]
MANDKIQEMLDAAVHFGHKTQKWNPKMRSYIYGSRNGIHFIDLYKTMDALEKAQEFLKHVVSNGKTVLMVSTKPQAAQLIIDAANETNMPYVVNKWMGGLLTNFSTMKHRIRYFRKLRDEEKSGEFAKYTKKEASALRKDIVKLETALGGVRDMEKLPDVLFIADVVRDENALYEARKLKIPVVAIVDTNSDPDGIDYPIPGNDDAIKSLTYLISAVKSAILIGKSFK